MKAALLGLAAVVLAGLPGRALDLRQRTDSASKQFIVFSEDVRLRQSVASFAEDVKRDVLQLLGETNLWKAPIVITLARPTTQEMAEPPARLRLIETQPGFKIEITIKIGDDPAAVNLRKQILRAVLLEYAYRESGVTGGLAYVDPPWWVIEGLIETDHRRAVGTDSDLFRRLVETNKLPPIEHFLMEKPEEIGPTALAVDRALAMALLTLLVEQPGGRQNLARFLRHWPESNGDPAALLGKEFPTVAAHQQTLQKWWTLNLARLASADRYQALTTEETDKALAPLLQFEVGNKAGEKRMFAVADFDQYLKLPDSRATLAGRRLELLALSTRANALLLPVIADYQEIFAQLARGKSRGVRDRLAKTEEYRQLVLRRTAEIADYLNWFEASQMGVRSNAFDNYLKTASELSEQERKQKGEIGRYLDEIEQEF